MTPESAPVQERAEITQDVLDRLMYASPQYLKDLQRLNDRYPLHYETRHGMRVLKRMTKEISRLP